MAQAWPIRIAGKRHLVALGKGRLAFSVDGVQHDLGGLFGRGPRRAEFDLDGHAGSITLTLVAPSMSTNFKRLFLRGGLRRLPLAILAYVVGGAGVGGGAFAASASAQIIYQWAIYELRVDGESRGSWVSFVTGNSSSWKFVEPDGTLPDRHSVDWPVWPSADA